jgi:hypothetical protein
MGSPTRDARLSGHAAEPARSACARRRILGVSPRACATAGRWPATARRRASTWRRALLRDLGGVAGLSAQERTLVDVATRTWLYLSALDAWLLEQPDLVDTRRRAVLPALRERTQLTESLLRCLQALGVVRRHPGANLTEYLSRRSPASAPHGVAPRPPAR